MTLYTSMRNSYFKSTYNIQICLTFLCHSKIANSLSIAKTLTGLDTGNYVHMLSP